MKTVSSSFSSARLEDSYSSLSEFEIMLEYARMSARTDFEENFVRQAKEKYEQYSGRMFWSQQQDDLLRKIAGPDD